MSGLLAKKKSNVALNVERHTGTRKGNKLMPEAALLLSSVLPAMKRCPRCNEAKPLDAFGKDKQREDGKTIHCRICKRTLEKARAEQSRISITCPQCSKERLVQNRGRLCPLCRNCSHKGHKWTQHQREIMLTVNTGANSKQWKGGRVEAKGGYAMVWVSQDNFFYPMAKKSHNTTGYILEHRLVMAKHLNRCLLPWEVVHHKNGIKNDNRLENLELLAANCKHNTILDRQIKHLLRENTKLKAELAKLRSQLKGGVQSR